MKIKLLLSKWTSLVEEGALGLRTRLTAKLSQPPARRLQLRQLEERVMMSAAPVPVEVPSDAAASGADTGAITDDAISSTAGDGLGNDFITVWSEEGGGDPEAAAKSREIVFVDKAAEDYEDLVADIINNADSTRDFDIYLLDSSKDGIDQITGVLADYSDVDAIHIVSHGDDGEVTLGNGTLDSSNLDGYAGAIASWGSALTTDGDLLIYGCDFAGNADGQALVQSISALTGADVAASTDDTGHTIFGGNWDLEYSTGQIETSVALSEQAQANWGHLLNVTIDSTTTGTAATNASSVTVSHTTSGTDRLMLVSVSIGDHNGDSVSGVTYNGNALSHVGTQAGVGQTRVEIWSLVAPDLGTHDVVVSFATNAHDGATVGAITFNDVHQTNALGAFGGADGDSASTATAGIASDANDLVFAAVAAQDSSDVEFTANTGSELWDLFRDTANASATTIAGAAGGVTANWTMSNNAQWAVGGVAINATSAVTPAWQIAGDTSVEEGDSAVYTISLSDTVGVGNNVSVDLAITNGSASSTDYSNFVSAINSAVSSRADLSFDGTTLTYDPGTSYSSSYSTGGSGFADISGSGTNLSLGDDQSAAANIGFDFDFFGVERTQLFVSSNGYVTFGSSTNAPTNQQMTGTQLGGRAAIAAFWDDLDPSSSGAVYVDTVGSVGNRQFIVQWDDVPYFNGAGDTGRFQLVLSEASGEIEVRYDDVDFQGTSHDDGRSATIAIQDGAGTAIQHSFNTASVEDNSKVVFSIDTAATMEDLSFTLETIDDETAEGDETLTIGLSNAVRSEVGASNQLTTTIVNDDFEPIATDNANTVVEDVTLTATGNLITDDDGFGVDFVDSTVAKSDFVWSDQFTNGETLAPRTVDGVEIALTFADPDGISSGASFTAQTVSPQGGSTSYARMSIDAPEGFTSSRVEITTTFDQAVQDLSFFLYDLDNGTTWGDDIIVHAYNGTTAVAVTLTPVTPGRHNVNGNQIEAVGGVVANTSSVANVFVEIDSPITSFVIDYGYTDNVTTTNPAFQIMGIGDFDFRRFNYATTSAVEAETDPNIDVTGSFGTIDWDAEGNYVYTLDNGNATVQALGVGETLIETFEYTITDLRGDTDTGTLTITIEGTNDVPIIDLNDDGTTADRSYSASFTEADAAVPITDVDSTVLDVDGDVSSLSMTLGGFTDGGSEHLIIGSSTFNFGTSATTTESFGGTTFSISYDGGTSITVTNDAGGTMSVGDLSLLTRQISYENVSLLPTEGARTIGFSVNDGFVDSNTATSTIAVTRNAESVEWSIAGTDVVAEGSNATYTISQSAAMRNGETAEVTLTLTDTTASATDHANFVTAVQVAVTAYSGPGSIAFNSATNVLSFTSDGTGTMADLGISFAINNDSQLEMNEDFTVALSSPTSETGQVVTIAGGAGSVDTTINDSTTSLATITATDAVASEAGSNPGEFTIDLGAQNQTGGDITVTYSISGTAAIGTDYTALTGTATVANGSQTVVIDVSGIIDDNSVEGNETVIATLTGTSLVSVGVDTQSATVTIEDNDSAAVTIADVSVAEDGTMTFTATLDSAVQGGFDVDVNFADITATGLGTDYTSSSQTLTFLGNVGETQQFTVTVVDDSIVEAVESFTVSMSNLVPVSAPAGSITISDTAIGTIADNDAAVVTVADVTVNEAAGTATITVNLDNDLDQDLTVDVSFGGDGSDFANAVQSVTWTAGETGDKTFTVAITDDDLVEAVSEDFNIALAVSATTPLNGRDVSTADTGTLSITDNDTTVVTIEDVSVAEDGTMTFTATSTTAVEGGFMVDVDFTTGTAGAADFTATSQTLTFAGTAGETQSFTVALNDDTLVEAAESFTVSMSGVVAATVPVGAITVSDTATGTIIDNDAAVVTVADVTVNEAAGTATISVNLDNDLDQNLTVDVSFGGDGSDFAAATQSVTWVAGETGVKTFTVAITDDDLVEAATEDFSIALAVNSATPLNGRDVTTTDTGTLSITDNDATVVTIEDVNVAEDGTMTFTATSTNAVDGGFTVDVDFTTGTASAADFNTTTQTLTFAGTAGETQDFTVVLNDDTLVEATESFSVSMSGVVAATVPVASITVSDTATGTITDNDSAVVTVADVTVNEGDGTATITVNLDNDLDQDLTVDVSFGGDGSDFASATQSVTWIAGETGNKTFTVAITDDLLVEATVESFNIDLAVNATTPLNGRAVTTTDTGTLSITDNDSTSVTIEDVTVTEDGTMTFTATSSAAVDGGFTVDVDFTTGTASLADFRTNSQTLAFTGAAGETQSFSVALNNDTLVEAPESFSVSMSGVVAATVPVGSINISDTAIGTIIDNDAAVVTVADVTVNESAGTATITVNLDNDLDQDLTVDVSFGGDGSDFANSTQNVTWTAGETGNKTFTIAITDDLLVEATVESFRIDLAVNASTPLNGRDVTTNDTGTLSITDNDSTSVTIEDVTVAEDGTMTFTATSTNAVDGGFTVDVDFMTGTAGAADFTTTSQTLAFAGTAGETQDFSVVLNDDGLVEAAESFSVSMSSVTATVPVGSIDVTDTATGTITDNDAAVVTVADVTVNEGDGTATITVNLDNDLDQDLTVDVSFGGDGSDFANITQNVTWLAGETGSKTFTVAIADDDLVEATVESFSIALAVNATTPLNGRDVTTTDTGTLSITDNDSTVVTIENVTVAEDGTMTFTATSTNAVDGGFTVDVDFTTGTAGVADFTTTSQTLTFAGTPGETQNFNVAINDDSLVEAAESFSVSMSSVTSTAPVESIDVTDTATGTITDDDNAVVTVADVMVNEGDGTATITVNLDNDLDQDLTVDVSFGGDGSDFANATQSVTWTAGESGNKTFTVAISDDDRVEAATEDFNIALAVSATTPLAGRAVTTTDTGTLSITDNDSAAVTIDDVTVAEDGTMTFTATSTNAVDGGFTVDVDFTTGTAGAADFATTTQTLTFIGTAGETQAFAVALTDDTLVETAENFSVSMSGIVAATVPVGSINISDTATGTIIDNDAAVVTVADVSVNEADGTATITVSLDSDLDQDLTVDVSFGGDGSDFANAAQSVTWTAGETGNKSFTVAITDDDLVEATTEDFNIALAVSATTPLNGRDVTTTDTGTLSITDNDATVVTIEDVTVAEDGTMTFTATSTKAVDGGFTVDVDFTTGTAGAADFAAISQTLTFAGTAGETQDFNVALTNDTLVESAESFSVSMSSVTATVPVGSIDVTDTATGTIIDNDAAVVTVADVTVNEDDGTATITVNLDNDLDQDLTIDVSFGGDGSDFANTTQDVTWTAGETGSKTFTVAITDDNLVEATTEDFNIALAVNAATPLSGRDVTTTDTGTLSITDNDSTVVTIEDVTVAEDGTMTFTATSTNAVDGGFTVDVDFMTGTAGAADFTSTSQTLTFAGTAGETQTFTVTLNDDALVEGSESFTVSMSGVVATTVPVGSIVVTDTATGTITDNDNAVVTVADVTVNETAGTATITVNLDNDLDQDLTVDVSFGGDGSDFANTTQSVTWNAGENGNKTFTVAITDDNLVEATTEDFSITLAVSATTPLDGRDVTTTDTGTLSITDNDSTAVTIEDVSVAEDGTMTFTATSTNAVDGGFTVDVDFATGTAGAADFATTSQTLTFVGTAGETQDFVVALTDDTLVEAAESFSVSMGGVVAANVPVASIIVSDTATGTIIDNDAAVVTVGDVTVNESAGTATITVNLDNDLDQDLTVDVNFGGDGSDFANATQSVTWSAGAAFLVLPA